MGTGSVTPPPTLYTPPPRPPPSPGPRPPPLPDPTPPPSPLPIPPPNPGPLEAGPATPFGSPQGMLELIWGSFSSGAPNSVGATSSFGVRLGITAIGGASCILENLGTTPLEAGVGERSPPPPPPPAFLPCEGKVGRYGEMSTASNLLAAFTGCHRLMMM